VRTIEASLIRDEIEKLFIQVNYHLPEDVKFRLEDARRQETHPVSKNILDILVKNYQKAAEGVYPLCQDTGMSVVFLEIGQDLHISGGSLKDAVSQGVENAYKNGYLRKSVVKDPFRRENTGNNLPPVIHTEITDGDQLKISVLPKGFGSENQSGMKMMMPHEGREGVIRFIVDGVVNSGGKGCPPCIIGVGIGGTFEYSAYLSKKALLKDLREPHPDLFYQEMEQEIMNRINESGVGSMGVGGKMTCIGVRILAYPTHITALPVSYNYCCHAARHKSVIL
jgi:fumarate hydratase subunit alpha